MAEQTLQPCSLVTPLFRLDWLELVPQDGLLLAHIKQALQQQPSLEFLPRIKAMSCFDSAVFQQPQAGEQVALTTSA
jgi:hypothetical protein